ncbi:MAG TPA: hypothetical protein VL463_30850 [Kofleriaceae bacterium]|nr:hypothetical protein [Kofleriaceae bacterium]
MGTILVWATAWAFIAFVARMVAQPHRRAESGGKRVRAELDAIYGGEHEYARVSPAAFPDADLAFYDRSAAELEAMGWKRVADVEDLTLSRVYPERRTFLRIFVDNGGAIRAAIYHLRVRGASLLAAVGVGPRDLHVFELISESPRGQFLSTSNTKGLDKLTSPKEVEVERLEVGASLAKVVARHRERLTDRARKRGADAPVTMWTWDDVLASIQRGHAVAAKHRQAIGGLSREEVERFTGRPLNAAEEVFLREVRGEPAVSHEQNAAAVAAGKLGKIGEPRAADATSEAEPKERAAESSSAEGAERAPEMPPPGGDKEGA